MLLATSYAKNYAGIIGAGLLWLYNTTVRAILWALPISMGMVKSVFLLLTDARILSLSELSGDSVNSAVPDGEVFYGKFSV